MRISTCLLALAIITSCGGAASSEDSLEAAADVTSDISMSIPALDQMVLEEGTSVIVPLDRTVLALGADSLAAFAAEGSLEKLLEALVVPYAVDNTHLVDGAVLQTSGGQIFDVSVVDGTTTVGVGTLVELRNRDGVVLIVVDDLLET